MAVDIDSIQSKTDAILSTVTSSAATLANIGTLVTNLKQQIADLQSGSADQVKLQALSDTVDKISTAVEANAAAEAAITA